MFAFFRKQSRPVPFVPAPSPYTADEFRNNVGMVGMARDWLRSGLGVHMFGVLRNSIPYGYPVRGQDVNPTTAAIELGRVQGYMDCMHLLQQICTPPVEMPEPDQNYQSDEILKSEGNLELYERMK